ncbi:hypothetical protein IFM47457_02790 [Aspergillus lentulus]|nr:hypothetical protein IFM47457_02790 [Aspergillus lentulus]
MSGNFQTGLRPALQTAQLGLVTWSSVVKGSTACGASSGISNIDSASGFFRENSDLYWALSGSGPGTFTVLLSMTAPGCKKTVPLAGLH